MYMPLNPDVPEVIEGQSVTLVQQLGSDTLCIRGTVKSVVPLILRFEQESLPIDTDQVVIVLSTSPSAFAKATDRCESVTHISGATEIQFGEVTWNAGDRRMYPRWNIATHMTMRAVTEGDSGPTLCDFNGVTSDISLGGVWIDCDAPLPSGSLVQTELVLNPREVIRVLGIVVRTDAERNGFGVEFLDFVGASRYHLHEFLARKAA